MFRVKAIVGEHARETRTGDVVRNYAIDNTIYSDIRSRIQNGMKAIGNLGPRNSLSY